ncbi:MAG: VOC family protein [Saprospiraceae bacterium]|nr:VOC family protein [Saprospiraceae bacterium]
MLIKKINIKAVALAISILFVSSLRAQIEISNYNHVALAVKDIQKSTAFYKDIIGLQSVEVPDNLREIRSWFSVGATGQLHLLAGRAEAVTNNGLFGSHFSVTITDADKALKHLEKHDISYTMRERFDGIRQIFLQDPDGYFIELNESSKK